MLIPDQFNAADYFIDRHITEGRAEKIAIACGEQRITYRTLFSNVNRVGNGLLRLGVHQGDRILLLLSDIPEFAFTFFGAIKIGAVPVPLNPLLTSPAYKYFIDDAAPKILFIEESFLSKIEISPKEDFRIIVVSKENNHGHILFSDFIKESSDILTPVSTHKDDVAFWLYSSGSTGSPKACVHLQHDMIVCSENYAKGVLHITENDRCFSVSKLFFAYGLGNALYYPLSVGATSILMPGPPKPEDIFRIIEYSLPTLFFSVPSRYASLLAHPSRSSSDFDLSSIRLCISAGEVLPPSLFHRFQERFGFEILDGIGSTEALQTFISNRPGRVRPGSSGEIIPDYQAKIVNDDNNPIPQGTIGNLLIKSDATCAYYWNQPEKTAMAIQGEWLRTGDKYFQDKDGYFWHVGRTDDMIKSSGAWVSPVEVEGVLMEHPAVFEVAVVGRKSNDDLVRPVACVVLQNGKLGTPELINELMAFATDRLPHYKRPQEIVFFKELPKTATGKIQRFKLRDSKDFSEYQ